MFVKRSSIYTEKKKKEDGKLNTDELQWWVRKSEYPT